MESVVLMTANDECGMTIIPRYSSDLKLTNKPPLLCLFILRKLKDSCTLLYRLYLNANYTATYCGLL